MSKSTWTGAVNSDWANAGNWSPAGVPDASSDVTIATGDAVASASIGTVNSITDSSDLDFESAGTNTVATFLDNTGHLHVDANGGEGGTILNIGGALTNSGNLVIGNTTLSASDEVTAASLDNTGRIYLTGSSADQALLDVAGSAGFGAAGILSGYVRLAGDSAIEFSSTTGALANDGRLYLDGSAGDGGSSLTLPGALNNSGSLFLGNYTATLSASDKLTAASLDNAGGIYLTGSETNQALLDVAGSAGFGTAGVLSGNVELAFDTAIEFASGQISTIGAGSQLDLYGNDAFIEDSAALGSNSALTGLASIGAGATLTLQNNAAVSTTGALANDGNVDVGGGSSLTVARALTNSGSLSIANSYVTAGALTNSGSLIILGNSYVTAAALDNTGDFQLVATGSSAALLDVTAGAAGFGAAGVSSGYVELYGDTALEFVSGQISTIGASSRLSLIGNDAFIEDSTALGSNSALTGLASIGAGALFELERGASVSTTGALANSGGVSIGSTSTGSSLSIAGALTNTGTLGIGNIDTGGSGSVTANSFVNSGAVDLSYGGTLNVSGALTNNGSISIGDDPEEELAGAVGGTGSFRLTGNGFLPTTLQFDSSVSSGQTISEIGEDDALTLKQAQSFAATISGFGTGDTIDATNFLKTATSYNFVENIAGTGGTLSLHDGSLTANILMTGDYSKSSFTLAPDSGTGTLVKFV